MQSVEAAAKAVAARIERLATERVPLAEAGGRVLADDIVAARALPIFDNSAMDGYAARSAELPATLPVVGQVAAGQVMTEPVPPGVAIRILTGAPMPAGLDTVVIQEDAKVDGANVTLPASPVGDNVRRAGEDINVGETAVTAGTQLGAGSLGLLAALGLVELSVVKRPRVALITTGDELVDVTTTPLPGQIVDSSAHMLGAMVTACGGVPSYFGIAKDDPISLAAMIASAFDHDAIITTGGVSVGDRDHVRSALTAAGVELELWKVAMKPGKPFSFGVNGRVPVFGLPGNPVSSFVVFELFVRPALLAMGGAAVTERPRAPVNLVRGYRKQEGRAHYIRARLERNGEHLIAHPHPKQGSAMLTSLIGCNALVELAADKTEILPNSVVPALLLDAV
ncbi:MAG: molybdopterin molybdotransferase MoeA [Deltaproteobacteria bacterium]|nr:molybdopterin molybdotransferase MoeA [Deltaproteobacteria bacterium]